MKLKTATLCAGVGASIHFAKVILVAVSGHRAPLGSIISAGIFYVPLIIFFFVLYRNQK